MRHSQFNSINVVPFIDIMLVLLVIVLTTATFIQTGLIKVDLPQSALDENDKNKEPLLITITKEGEYFLDKTKTDKASLEASLKALKKSQPIHISCDKGSAFEHFVRVVEMLKTLNFENFGIITKP